MFNSYDSIRLHGRASRAGAMALVLAGAVMGFLASTADAQIRWSNGTEDRPARMTPADSAVRLRNLATAPRRHVMVTFDAAVTPAQEAALRAAGVELQTYLGSNTYFAQINRIRLNEQRVAQSAPMVDVREVRRDHKLHRELLTGDVRSNAIAVRTPSGGGAAQDWVAVYIVFHPGADLNVGANFVTNQGGQIIDWVESVNALVVEMPLAAVNPISDHDDVQWIEPALPLLTDTNDSNRERTRADAMQAPPYNLDGAGVTVMVYDGGIADSSHPDYGGRLTTHDSSGISGHATHVAGTIGGNGSLSNGTYRGMAPGVTLRSYGFQYNGSNIFLYSNPGDIETDYSHAINNFGAAISNNSIGSNVESNGFDCAIQGDYGVTSQTIDEIVRGSQGDLIRAVWAGGNERQGSRCDVEGFGDYYSVPPPSGAKNHLSVGATNANDNSVTSFTSWGPTDDGRLKPDICAPGCQSNGDGAVTSIAAFSTYTTACGTSMASPTLAGMAALLLEDYRNHFPAAPDYLPSTQKVLFVHTADDIQNTGPDYQTGYGVARIDKAIEHMRDGSYAEDSVTQGATDTYMLEVPPGTAELKITLAWDDYPAAPLAGTALVNDLDLRVFQPGGTQRFPWTLNPAVPASAAVQNAEDHLNNIEQVRVLAPVSGTWTIQVRGTTVPQGPQTYSIALSPNLPRTGIEVLNPTNLVSPSSPTTITAHITTVGETLLSQTLHYSVNAGPVQNVAMSSIGGELYEGDIPAVACGSTVTYYVSANTSVTGTIADPFDAPASSYAAQVGTINEVFADDFESNLGWSAGVGGDTATTGQWERGDPIGTGAQPEFDKTVDPGNDCYFTGQGTTFGSLGEEDIDGGVTTLMSPTINVNGMTEARVSYWRWFSNNSGASPNADTMDIQVSNNNGSSWTTVETLGPNDADSSGGWIFHEFRIADFVTPTSQVRVRFRPADSGSGSIVEAALDEFRVTLLDCMAGCPDADGDGVCDPNDICPGGDDNVDGDGDGVPDFCDICPGGDDNVDADGDGVPNGCDICPGGDDNVDGDGDGVPDFCDPCPIDNPDDSDGDGVCDSADVCPGGDDNVDTDGDGVADFCDTCPLDNPDDSDGDGVCDSADVCPGGDDNVDTDGDGVADFCDPCPIDNPDDSDGDGVCDSADVCPGGDDNVDTDGDGVADFCDTCPLDNPDDTDGDGVCDSSDICPGGDDNIDTDGDGIPDFCDTCNGSNAGDFDCDGDVDLADFGIFANCFGGSFNPPAATCPAGVNADLDGDGDVDAGDFAIFSQNFTGSL